MTYGVMTVTDNLGFSYRYQLEVFVDKIRGREPQAWITSDDSIANMEWIEKIYKEVCQRFSAQFVLQG